MLERRAMPLDARAAGSRGGGPSFPLRHRAERTLFMLVWAVLAGWTPPPLHRWRCAILRAFGATIGTGVRIYRDTIVWYPPNLTVGDWAVIAPRVRIYCQGVIVIGPRAVVSQGAHLCSGTHDINDPHFQLVTRPIAIGADAWIAAEAFVGPGVTIGEGALLGARGVAMRNLDAWTVYSGNPAQPIKQRRFGSAEAAQRLC